MMLIEIRDTKDRIIAKPAIATGAPAPGCVVIGDDGKPYIVIDKKPEWRKLGGEDKNEFCTWCMTGFVESQADAALVKIERDVMASESIVDDPEKPPQEQKMVRKKRGPKPAAPVAQEPADESDDVTDL